jgi:putative aldouronate transport system permease protein
MVYLLQKPLNYDVSDVISTYVYRRGIAVTEGFPNFSFATAVGLFQSIVNVTLLVGANSLSKKFSETSLF